MIKFMKLVTLALLSVTLHAHGGQYRGPGDVVPPGGGGRGSGRPTTPGGPSGPSTGRPSGPTAPTPQGPVTGGPRTPAGGPTGGPGPTTGGRGYRPTVDLTGWQFWWEFNKDPFLKLRETILEGPPQAMDSTNNVDIITACMISMAKVGKNHPDFKLLDVFRPHLASNNQEVRETAALALGIAALGK